MSLQQKKLWMKRQILEESFREVLDKYPEFSYAIVLDLIRTGKVSKPAEYSDERFAANLYSMKKIRLNVENF